MKKLINLTGLLCKNLLANFVVLQDSARAVLYIMERVATMARWSQVDAVPYQALPLLRFSRVIFAHEIK